MTAKFLFYSMICISLFSSVGAQEIMFTYYKDDNSKIEKEFAYDTTKHCLDGPFKEYYKSGDLKIKGQYRNGLLIGNHISYFQSGQIQKSLNYKIVPTKDRDSVSILYDYVLVFYDNDKNQIKCQGKVSDEFKSMNIEMFTENDGE